MVVLAAFALVVMATIAMTMSTKPAFLLRGEEVFEDEVGAVDTSDDDAGADSTDADHDEGTDSDADVVVYAVVHTVAGEGVGDDDGSDDDTAQATISKQPEDSENHVESSI